MDPAPRISVLIPVYNRDGTIGECIHSAIDQTWRDLEVVISDNRSSDGTWAICESMAQRDARIRLVRNERNLGPVRNWKRCLDEALGELAILLFSDDSLRPEFLEKAAPYLDDPEVGLAFAAVTHGPAPERGRLLYTWGGREGKVSSRRFLCDAMVHNGALPCSPGATLFRLADLRKNLATEVSSPSMGDFAGHGAGPDLLLLLRTAAQYAGWRISLNHWRTSGTTRIRSPARSAKTCWQATTPRRGSPLHRANPIRNGSTARSAVIGCGESKPLAPGSGRKRSRRSS